MFYMLSYNVIVYTLRAEYRARYESGFRSPSLSLPPPLLRSLSLPPLLSLTSARAPFRAVCRLCRSTFPATASRVFAKSLS
jgi:hypothetical protein